MLSPCSYVLLIRVNCNCKYNFTDDGKKLSPRRDVPSYPKVNMLVRYLRFMHEKQTVCMESESRRLVYAVHTFPGDYRDSQEAHV